MTLPLPDRLRTIAFHHARPGLVPDVMREAADRIEELQAALLDATAFRNVEALHRGESLKKQIVDEVGQTVQVDPPLDPAWDGTS